MTVVNEEFPYSLLPNGKDYNWRRGKHLVLFYKYMDYIIWGFTARMTKKEFEILVFLILHRGRICSREEILSKVWKGEVVVLDRTIDVNITRLRSKIGEYGGWGRLRER